MATYKLVDEEKMDAAMTATADAIRAKTGGTDPIAWDAEKGMSEAVEPVFEAGKKAEYDAFWDNYASEDRTNYDYAFAGPGWGNRTFSPKKKNIVPNRCQLMFSSTGIKGDLTRLLMDSEIYLDTSSAIYMTQMFSNAKGLTRVPDIDMTNAGAQASLMFYGCNLLETIDSIRVTETNRFDSMFDGCIALQNIVIIGVIASKFNIGEAKTLSRESCHSILNALSDKTTALTVTLSLTAVNTAFETSPGAADGSASEEWTTLIATKPNWTISLV